MPKGAFSGVGDSIGRFRGSVASVGVLWAFWAVCPFGRFWSVRGRGIGGRGGESVGVALYRSGLVGSGLANQSGGLPNLERVKFISGIFFQVSISRASACLLANSQIVRVPAFARIPKSIARVPERSQIPK